MSNGLRIISILLSRSQKKKQKVGKKALLPDNHTHTTFKTRGMRSRPILQHTHPSRPRKHPRFIPMLFFIRSLQDSQPSLCPHKPSSPTSRASLSISAISRWRSSSCSSSTTAPVRAKVCNATSTRTNVLCHSLIDRHCLQQKSDIY